MGHSAGPESSEKEKHITQEETQDCSEGQLPALGAEPWARIPPSSALTLRKHVTSLVFNLFS